MNENSVYEVNDIKHLLNVGRNSAYNYIKEVYKTQNPFKVIKIGRVYRIPKTSFDEWFYN